MDFKFPLDFLDQKKEHPAGFSVWNAEKLRSHFATKSRNEFTHMCQILDDVGIASAKAQKLGQPITNASVITNSEQTVYLHHSNNRLNAVLKIGHKNLFIFNMINVYVKIQPICVLDFYVHESMQRKGIGRLLFEYMLMTENTAPNQLAYDAPSAKLKSFLGKYYGLKSFTAQSNNYVVYHDYFGDTKDYHFEPLPLRYFMPNIDTITQNSDKNNVNDADRAVVEHKSISNREPSPSLMKPMISESTKPAPQPTSELQRLETELQSKSQKLNGLETQFKEKQLNTECRQYTQSSNNIAMSPSDQLKFIQSQIDATKSKIADSERKIHKINLQRKSFEFAGANQIRNEKSKFIKKVYSEL